MSYRNLEIGKLSCGLVVDIHQMSLANLTLSGLFEPGPQIRRSMKSMRSNLVEGRGRRRCQAEFVRLSGNRHPAARSPQRVSPACR